MSFKGKTAIITGASRGIGAATALHLADLGANVMLLARSNDEINELAVDIRAHGQSAEALTCDVSKNDDVENAIAACRDRFGGLDILVNNAGLIDPIARLDESDPDAWGRVMEVNVMGVYYMLRSAIPLMTQGGGGTIINISSIAAVKALEGWSHYCASKAAVLSLTRSVMVEYGAQGVTCVGLSPGTVATGMQKSIAASGLNPVSKTPWDAHIPPEWVAKAIAWLADGGAAEYAGTDFSIKHKYGRRAVGLPEDGALDNDQ